MSVAEPMNQCFDGTLVDLKFFPLPPEIRAEFLAAMYAMPVVLCSPILVICEHSWFLPRPFPEGNGRAQHAVIKMRARWWERLKIKAVIG